jgi:hypothetical protein
MSTEDDNLEAYRRQAEADDRRRDAENRAREVKEGWEYLRRGRTGLAIGRIAGPEAAIRYYEALGAAPPESRATEKPSLAALHTQLGLVRDDLAGTGPDASMFGIPPVQLPRWLEERFEIARAVLPLFYAPLLLADIEKYAAEDGGASGGFLAVRLVLVKARLDELSRMVAEYNGWSP